MRHDDAIMRPASQPVLRTIAHASSGERMSPLPITGILIACFTAAIHSQRARRCSLAREYGHGSATAHSPQSFRPGRASSTQDDSFAVIPIQHGT